MDLPAWSPSDPEAWQAVRDRLPPPSGERWPGGTEYLLDLVVLLQRRLLSWIDAVVPFGVLAEEAWSAAVYALAAAAAGILLWVAVRFLLHRTRRRDLGGIEPEIRPVQAMASTETPGAWFRRFRRRLEEASSAGALEALWWWVATCLDPRGLSPSWTTDQLLASAGRPELEAAMRDLDRLRYGRRSGDREDILGLYRRLREILR